MGQVRYRLFLGNKVYSSWSLRAWLLLVPFDIAFEQEVVPLYTDAFESFRKRCRPARQVPTLLAMQGPKRIVVWDSLAIAEFLHERHPEAGIWPADPIERAAARSLCAEMHAGFKALRSTMPMNLRRSYANFAPDQDAREDIARVQELWRWARSNWGGDGPYLFGQRFSAADAFFAPVAARFRTYAIELDETSRNYADALLSHPASVAFHEDAQAETWVMQHNEFDDGRVGPQATSVR